ncbi:methylisocitrate lyase [Devosia ginsengisoli]|uniref:Methylisocitrate lyase n=1 Tax=Devosia ginsengisoli TaxID=400770 RepID=A0A5B8LQE2_9HYPH|nr:methylisocitrate lyase [Devosia ginsengisoli]QDZ10241.1 methylisocitrate lyase [Devosia ginsengisoli]
MSTDWLDGAAQGRADRAAVLRQLIARKQSVAVPGAADGMSAQLARDAGFEALYLSGAAVSASMALPDLGMLTLEDVTRKAREVVRASGLPLIVDADTGFGEVLNIMRAVRELEEAGAACIQIEDQVFPKKCGHLNDKSVVPVEDMCRKIAAARQASSGLLICARTDAGTADFDDAIRRANRYVAAGADVIFVEALHSIEAMRRARAEIAAPLLANMTEFGRTPQTSLQTFNELGYELVIYPVSAARAAWRASKSVYEAIKRDGEVGASIDTMMTRAELYQTIGYYDYEALDAKIVKTVLE